MGQFIAYRHTGADPERLGELLPAVKTALEGTGTEVYCTYFDEADFKGASLGARQIMDHAFSLIEKMGSLFVLLDSDEKSEGMLMEVGYCIAREIPITVARNREVQFSYLPQMADVVIEYATVDELCSKIKEGEV